MYSGKEAQGQSEIPEGHCIKEVKLFHKSKMRISHQEVLFLICFNY